MTTQQLESFVQVAENLNFARAAENLNVTTSAVSRQIRSLEEELDIQLLHRSTKSVMLTPAGISFLNDAKEILAKLKIASSRLKEHSASNIQVLTIGCTYEPSLSLLTPVLSHCKEEMPELHPFLRVVPSKIGLNLFIQSEMDFLFGFQNDIPLHDGMHYKELMQCPVCCVVSSSHDYASLDAVSEQQLSTDKMVICNSYELPTKAAIVQNRLSHQFSLNNTYFCENPITALAMIKAGFGFGILPDIDCDDQNVSYIPMQEENYISYGVYYKDISNNPIAKKFLSLLTHKEM